MKVSLRNSVIGVLIIFGVLRLTGALTYYTVSTSACEPNLKLGSHFIGSNFVTPDRLDIAYYKYNDEMFGNIVIVQRLIAVPGDVLECKKGAFYVNDVHVDASINLRKMYIVDMSEIKQFNKKFSQDESVLIMSIDEKIFGITLDESYVSSNALNFERYYSNDNDFMSNDIKSKTKTWDTNNFGPIQVPEKKYFFVGDNRDNSMDSRTRGFIDEDAIKGTLLFQF